MRSNLKRHTQATGPVRPAEAAIWLATPDAAAAFDAGALSPRDQARYAVIKSRQRRRDFQVSRALHQHVGVSTDQAAGLTHSGGYAACVQFPSDGGAGRVVGVDIEAHKPRDVRSIARFAFAEEEAAELDHLPDDECERRFYALWTMKEALAKALRLSLLDALRRCVFVECDSAWLVQAPDDRPCSVLAFEPQRALTLAVACVGGGLKPLHLREWPPGRFAQWPLVAHVNARRAPAAAAAPDGARDVPYAPACAAEDARAPAATDP